MPLCCAQGLRSKPLISLPSRSGAKDPLGPWTVPSRLGWPVETPDTETPSERAGRVGGWRGRCHQYVVSVNPVGNSAGASWACSHLVLITAPWGRELSLHPICEERRAGATGPLAQGHTQGGKEAGLARGVQGPTALPSALGEGSWASGRLGSRSSRPGSWLRAQAPVDTPRYHLFLPSVMAVLPSPSPAGCRLSQPHRRSPVP